VTPRYALAKTLACSRRLCVRIWAGMLLVLASHFWADAWERDFARDVGALVVTVSLGQWLSAQGKRRVDPGTGETLRHPTMRFFPSRDRR
jgi:hypothetical protein